MVIDGGLAKGRYGIVCLFLLQVAFAFIEPGHRNLLFQCPIAVGQGSRAQIDRHRKGRKNGQEDDFPTHEPEHATLSAALAASSRGQVATANRAQRTRLLIHRAKSRQRLSQILIYSSAPS